MLAEEEAEEKEASIEGYVTRTLPDTVSIFRSAGKGFEASASSGRIVADIEPEIEVREMRSLWVKVPAMALEVVCRIVWREVQLGRVMGWEVERRVVRSMRG